MPSLREHWQNAAFVISCTLFGFANIAFCQTNEQAPAKISYDEQFVRESQWHGYRQLHFKVAERAAYVVIPKQSAEGKPWIWRARFPNYHAEMDIQLLARGFHIAFVDVAGLLGSPQAVEIGDRFYERMTDQLGFAKQPALEGVSRGGLFVYNWAARNPDKVACIYCDTPVCDIRSWPGGKGDGLGHQPTWEQCLAVYNLTEESAKSFAQNPIDQAKAIAGASIPILHIVSRNDRVVPARENTSALKERLEQHGHTMQIIWVAEGTQLSNGHHFEHPNPKRVVDFILKHTTTAALAKASDHTALLKQPGGKRIVFLGDSITYAGNYVAIFETWVGMQRFENPPLVINMGLPSETVSGLSEDGHAGGRFPRPDLVERLDRVLLTTKPDLVFACYGINCGIYQPFDPARFQAYQQGILNLKHKVEAADARLILITPPTFDDQRAKKDFSYDAVMKRYSNWLIERRDDGWTVIDLHSWMDSELARQRKSDPEFTFQPDSVHPDDAGHWLIASCLIRWFGGTEAAGALNPGKMLQSAGEPAELLPLIQERMNITRNLFLNSAGHQRPGINSGLPADQARQQMDALTKRIDKLIKK